MSTKKHSPLPWSYKDGWAPRDQIRDRPPTVWIQIFDAENRDGERGDFVWQLEAPSHDKKACERVVANAQTIVRAVNSHDALVKVAEDVIWLFGDEKQYCEGTIGATARSNAKAALLTAKA